MVYLGGRQGYIWMMLYVQPSSLKYYPSRQFLHHIRWLNDGRFTCNLTCEKIKKISSKESKIISLSQKRLVSNEIQFNLLHFYDFFELFKFILSLSLVLLSEKRAKIQTAKISLNFSVKWHGNTIL